MFSSIDNINIQDFNYILPDDRIALYPAEKRDHSRLLVRFANGEILDDHFHNLPVYLNGGNKLFFNNSKVIPARLLFFTPNGARIEIFCLKPVDPFDYALSLSSLLTCQWECIIGNTRKFREPQLETILVHNDTEISFRAEKVNQQGNIATIRFSWNNKGLTFAEILQLAGKTPLPPYIKRNADPVDRERYQTVYSTNEGSVAAPTAGLHFTRDVLHRIESNRITCHEVTLHVGAGTFQPVKHDNIARHQMHAEFFIITDTLMEELMAAETRVICVGTTTVRTLESIYWVGVKLLEHAGILPGDLKLEQWECYTLSQNIPAKNALSSVYEWLKHNNLKKAMIPTQLLIVPGYTFRITGTLITNFHQPGSTLLLLVAAFIGDAWKAVYDHALKQGYRFLSYGDSSLLFTNR